jgi:carboxyl-terminal processing protease
MRKSWKLALLSLLISVIVLSSTACSLIYLNPLTPATQSAGITTVKQVWDYIQTDYVDPSRLDNERLSQAAIEGMLAELDDPHSAYMDAASYQQFMESLQGNFEGIGATINQVEGRIVIVSPLPGSPAEKAGLRAGDTILAVDGVTTDGLTAEEAVVRVRGAAGTTVTLTIRHAGEAISQDIAIVRAAVDLPTVGLVIKENIAWIQITGFSDNTDDELGNVLDRLTEQGATGIILDLRDNPGGSVDAVVKVASRFIESGVILYQVDKQGQRQATEVNHSGSTTDLPMVVLVNENSASAAEVLTGALQDTERAVIAGTITFGKGSVNNLYQLNDGSALYLTVMRWLTPNGTLIEGKGITPDYTIDVQGEAPVNWAIDYLLTRAAPSPMMRQPVPAALLAG